MDLKIAGKTLSQPYQQMASTSYDTGSPRIRVKEVEPLRKLLLSEPTLLVKTAKEPHPFSKLTELPSTSASEGREEYHGDDKRTRANFSEKRRRNHQAKLYQALRDTLGVSNSTSRQTIITICIELVSLREGTSFQPKQKIVELNLQHGLSKTEWHNHLERERRDQLKKSLEHLKECLKLTTKTSIKAILEKCLEEIRAIRKKDQSPSRYCRQEKHPKSTIEKKIATLSTRTKKSSIEQHYLEKIKIILCIPKDSTRQYVLANALYFIQHKEKPEKIQIQKMLGNIKRMTNNTNRIF
ncbi:helix-loop-helix domain-containing protein [Endozoicomonas atrinae]|uniref:helix-loop-helix domain-containing protein n=1 Tax=Endozoicomonas atrinae TaxID=1333660 RepID=UPI000825D311|nr:helix-loop-helix domain-containing protein [Endozoicomonas atrinae]